MVSGRTGPSEAIVTSTTVVLEPVGERAILQEDGQGPVPGATQTIGLIRLA